MVGENGVPETPDWQPEPRSLVLSGEDFDRILTELDKPPVPNEALKRAVERHLIRGEN